MKKEISAEEARIKAEAYCSVSEHCVSEVMGKLQQWGAPEDAWEAIVCHLEKERYIDEHRMLVPLCATNIASISGGG